jgi:hypothetical protein
MESRKEEGGIRKERKGGIRRGNMADFADVSSDKSVCEVCVFVLVEVGVSAPKIDAPSIRGSKTILQ